MRRVAAPNVWGLSFNLTPMIDVIFQLIIFFLCVTQYEKAETAEEVRLPVADSSQVQKLSSEAETNRLVLHVLADGRLRVTGQDRTIAELAETIERKQKAIEPSPLEIWIRGDREVPFQVVEPVLVACAERGVTRVAFKVISREQEAREARP